MPRSLYNRFKDANAARLAVRCQGVSDDRDLGIITNCNSIYAICPNTDPNLIGLSSVNLLETTLDTPFSTCGSYLTQFPCDSDLGFPSVAGGIFYGPDNLPASGNQTLSNLAGTVTSPASGAVFTYTNGANSQVYTISAASISGTGSGATITGNGRATTTGKSGSTSGGLHGTTTATGTAGSASATKSTGRKIENSTGLLISGVMIGLMTALL